MHCRAFLLSKPCHAGEPFPYSLIAYRRMPVCLAHPVLSEQVSDPHLLLDGDELYLAEGERGSSSQTLPKPGPVLPLGLRPALRQGKHETASPAADVVADMDDDARTYPPRACRISAHICDVHHLLLRGLSHRTCA